MERYIDANELLSELVKLKGRVSYANFYDEEYPVTQGVCIGLNNAIKALQTMPTVDVALQSEVAKEVLLELKKQIHDKAVYTNSQDVANYVQLKVFDAVLNNIIKKYTEGGGNV